MAKPNLEEIKLKADEYAKLAKQIERLNLKREEAMRPVIERHAEELNQVLAGHDPKIERLQAKADGLRSEVIAFLGEKKKFFAASSELATFGVEIGTKTGPRVVDHVKFVDLCKRKSVDMWQMVSIMLGTADKLLGAKEVTAISEVSVTPTRNEYLKLLK